MAKANVLMAVSNDAQTMALLYKGEAIAVGNGKSIKETLKNIFTFARKEIDIATHLDELLGINALKYIPSWLPKRVIQTKIAETVTITGNYRKDIQHLISELKYTESVDFGAKIKSFNILNVPKNIADTSIDFFKEYNLPWLKQATDRGDDIVVMSDKFDNSLLKFDEKLTGFGKEIQFMDDLVKKRVYQFIKNEGKYIKITK